MTIGYVEDNASLGAPSAGDTVTITGSYDVNTTAVVTNVDQSALAAGGLAGINVTRRFNANIGSPSAPLKAEVNVSSASVFNYDAAGGSCWYTPDGSADICVTLRILGPGTMNLIGAGTVTNLEQRAGTCVVGSGITPTTVRIAGGSMLIDGVSGTDPTTIWAGGEHDDEDDRAELRTRRGFTTLNVFGDATVIIDCSSDNITTINSYGGMVRVVQCGTVTTWNMFGGTAPRLDVGRAITITTLNVWGSVEGIDAFIRNPFVTITNPINWFISVGEHADPEE